MAEQEALVEEVEAGKEGGEASCAIYMRLTTTTAMMVPRESRWAEDERSRTRDSCMLADTYGTRGTAEEKA